MTTYDFDDPEVQAHINELYGLPREIPAHEAWMVHDQGYTIVPFSALPEHVDFPEEARMTYLSAPEPKKVSKARRRLKRLFSKMTQQDAEMMDYFLKGYSQEQLADIYQIAQPSVCTRLQRARDHMRIAKHLDHYDLDAFWDKLVALSTYGKPEDFAASVLAYYWLPSEKDVSKLTGLSPGKVRSALQRADVLLELKSYALLREQWTVGRRPQNKWRGGQPRQQLVQEFLTTKGYPPVEVIDAKA